MNHFITQLRAGGFLPQGRQSPLGDSGEKGTRGGKEGNFSVSGHAKMCHSREDADGAGYLHVTPLGLCGREERTIGTLGTFTVMFVQEMRPFADPESKHSNSGRQDFLG